MNKLAPALIKAQKAFAPALKCSTNPHFRSKYADLAACLEAVSDALLENGIALIQKTHESETGVTVETVFIHESGEVLECGKLHVPASKQDPQGYGSALTYARRYSLMAACGIAPEDDDGNAASKHASKTQPTTNKVRPLDYWMTEIGKCKTLQELQTAWGVALASNPNDKAEINKRVKEVKELIESDLGHARGDFDNHQGV